MNYRARLICLLVIQGLLFFIELLTDYDTLDRQLALALTNLAAVVGIIWFDRWLHRRGARLAGLTIVLVAAAVWFDALGNFQHWYGEFWWWDRVTHTIGGMAVTAFFIDVYAARLTTGLKISRSLAVWIGFLVGQLVAALYEVSEWLGDWWFHTERVRGLYDSPRDLFFNLVGGLVVWGIFRSLSQVSKVVKHK